MMVLNFWLSGRVGYNFPSFYVFAQGDGIFQRFDNSVFNTNGYRVIGGVGTNDTSSLFKGEVYGGYQFQDQNQQNVLTLGVPAALGIPQDAGNGVFGGRLSYFPTEYWTIIASIDARFCGNVNAASARRSAGNSQPDDHCYPADDLWPLEAVVGRRPGRLYARRLHWTVRAR